MAVAQVEKLTIDLALVASKKHLHHQQLNLRQITDMPTTRMTKRYNHLDSKFGRPIPKLSNRNWCKKR
jgi:hypothetical protein